MEMDIYSQVHHSRYPAHFTPARTLTDAFGHFGAITDSEHLSRLESF